MSRRRHRDMAGHGTTGHETAFAKKNKIVQTILTRVALKRKPDSAMQPCVYAHRSDRLSGSRQISRNRQVAPCILNFCAHDNQGIRAQTGAAGLGHVEDTEGLRQVFKCLRSGGTIKTVEHRSNPLQTRDGHAVQLSDADFMSEKGGKNVMHVKKVGICECIPYIVRTKHDCDHQ